ncbi:hypothetical protein D5F01_LYC18629 [Larimichthys crocea]|uniref:Uncharacterized protein n=1 Tax=Larimichthys crocea TaxID=215358 RepID=A0A6G0HVD5_LARCR|nr:hypothetical protein D5F01_LYC18629 [Larimichthys crocea]
MSNWEQRCSVRVSVPSASEPIRIWKPDCFLSQKVWRNEEWGGHWEVVAGPSSPQLIPGFIMNPEELYWEMPRQQAIAFDLQIAGRGGRTRGGQSHGVPQDTVSPLPSHVKPHHLPLYPMHPNLHSCFDFQPKQTANPLAAAVAVPMVTAYKGTALALMIQICRDRQRGQFRASREIWMQAELSAGHWA